MKKTILALAFAAITFSCKNDKSQTLTTFNHADKEQTLNCTNLDQKLFSEAYYAFENAVLINAQNTNRNPRRTITTDVAFRNFTARAQNNVRVEDYITEETAEVYKVLKTLNIWDGDHLDYNADVVKCIAGSILNPNLKQTFKALQEVNSLNPKLMASSIYGNSAGTKFKDKALMTYVALDLFYAKMNKVDFSTIKYIVKADKNAVAPVTQKRPIPKKPEIGKPIKLDTKKAEKHGPHDGHNH